jgi:protein arginine kinase
MMQPIRGHVVLPAWGDGRGPEAETVISTCAEVVRNLAGRRFIPRASLSERAAIFENISALLETRLNSSCLSVVNFSSIPVIERQLLAEKGSVTPRLLDGKGDRGVAYDRRYRVNIMINVKDHLSFRCLDSGFCPEEMLKLAHSNEEGLGKRCEFASSRRWGFLTCRPVDSGAGVRLSFLMHLPGLALTRSIDMIMQGASHLGFRVSGYLTGHHGITGNLFVLATTGASGSDEAELIENARRLVAEIISNERMARRMLVREARLELTDRICRAYGILRHARTLSVPEYLNLSSALRLGCETGLFKGVAVRALNRSMFLVMPAHLRSFLRMNADGHGCGTARAEFVRNLLSSERRCDPVKHVITR